VSKEQILDEVFTVTFLGMINEELKKRDITLGYKVGDKNVAIYNKIAKDFSKFTTNKIKVEKSELTDDDGQGAVIAVKNFRGSSKLIKDVVDATAKSYNSRIEIEKKHSTKYTDKGAYTGRIISFKDSGDKKYEEIGTLETAEIQRKKTDYSSPNSHLKDIKQRSYYWDNIEQESEHNVYGYEHGMCRCINMMHETLSIRTKFEKPNIRFVPVECADGEATTKLAACVGCMTYLSANGYRPNAFHLGQSASWVPPRCNGNTEMEQGFRDWKANVKLWGGIGEGVLKEMYHIELSEEAKKILINTLYWQYFLDSLTYHKKDIDRLINVIKEELTC